MELKESPMMTRYAIQEPHKYSRRMAERPAHACIMVTTHRPLQLSRREMTVQAC